MNALNKVYNLVLKYKGCSLNDEECKIFQKLEKDINKKYELLYDDVIENFDILINHLESLKEESKYMITQDSIFKADYRALTMIINFLKDNKNHFE